MGILYQEVDEKNLPGDWESPEWSEEDKTHNWRNYISEELQEIWSTFSPQQKKQIAVNANRMANREDWD